MHSMHTFSNIIGKTCFKMHYRMPIILLVIIVFIHVNLALIYSI